MQVNLLKKSASLAGLAGLLMLTAACTSPAGLMGAYDVTATPANATIEKKITVSTLNPTIIVGFPAAQSGLSDMEKGRLLGFVDAQGINFGEPVDVEFPRDGGGGLNEQRFAAVASFLQDRGFKVSPRVSTESMPNALRVTFVKYVATVDPVCQKGWHKPEGLGYENLPLPYMGCANAEALAGMVANPRDLVDPSDADMTLGERAARAVEKYRGSSSGGAAAATAN